MWIRLPSSFAARTFLLSFAPCALLLAGSFLTLQVLVKNTVRETLRATSRDSLDRLSAVRARSELRSNRFLSVAGENTALKAGLELLALSRESPAQSNAARLTVEDQLREFCSTMGFGLLATFDPSGRPLAGVMKTVEEDFKAIDWRQVEVPEKGLQLWNGDLWQISSIPIELGGQMLGSLSVGERFDLTPLGPVALLHAGRALQSSLPGVSTLALSEKLRSCPPDGECTVEVGGDSYLSIPLRSFALGKGYTLRNLENLDALYRPVQKLLSKVLLGSFAIALLLALFSSMVSSGSISRPIAGLAKRLREAEATGVLPQFDPNSYGIQEIQELAIGFARAAEGVQAGKDRLHRAYVGFTESLASALDARDRYTAGHSRRVAELSCRTAAALGLGTEEIETIRVGALLHDIGKIGIADSILQKESRLTAEEFAIVQTHPGIGRRILEEVPGFAPWLDTVELHHENWDGSGYPHGLAGTSVPVAARIVHVADAWDAMTTDRPYRRGMPPETAMEILSRCAGSQFDPEIVRAFQACMHGHLHPMRSGQTDGVAA